MLSHDSYFNSEKKILFNIFVIIMILNGLFFIIYPILNIKYIAFNDTYFIILNSGIILISLLLFFIKKYIFVVKIYHNVYFIISLSYYLLYNISFCLLNTTKNDNNLIVLFITFSSNISISFLLNNNILKQIICIIFYTAISLFTLLYKEIEFDNFYILIPSILGGIGVNTGIWKINYKLLEINQRHDETLNMRKELFKNKNNINKLNKTIKIILDDLDIDKINNLLYNVSHKNKKIEFYKQMCKSQTEKIYEYKSNLNFYNPEDKT